MSRITILAVGGLATIQDGGRPGHMHEGVPPGGALVPELLARANRSVGNAVNSAAIELFGTMSLVADRESVIATDEGRSQTLAAGARFDITPSAHSRARYLAIRGGFDVPILLGGRGTLLVARFGGLEGRMLRRGDSIDAGASAMTEPRALPPFMSDPDIPIRIVLGPDRARFAQDAFESLLNSPFTVSRASDRTGIRLDGPLLARLDSDGGLSAPMVKGAIQVPASGAPIVLGPDHPTTGGYPVIASVIRTDFGQLAMRRPGATVRFVVNR